MLGLLNRMSVRAGQSMCRRAATTAVEAAEQSTSQQILSAIERKPFELLEDDKYAVPSFDLQRRIANIFMQQYYRKCYEKEFTVKGFLNGAEQAALLCAQFIRKGDWGSLKRIMIEETVNELRTRFEPFIEANFKSLDFSLNDIICSVIDSSYTCGKIASKDEAKGLATFFPLRGRAFYSQVIIYIKKSKDLDMSKSIEYLLKNSPGGSILICNITLSRLLKPLGMWKVTRVNFFDFHP